LRTDLYYIQIDELVIVDIEIHGVIQMVVIKMAPMIEANEK